MHIGELFQRAGYILAGVGGGISIGNAGTDLVQITVALTVPAIGGVVLWGVGWLFNRLFPQAGHPQP